MFLVPTQGAAEIRALHERLYGNSLRAFKRPDISYVPHLTVAAHSSVQSAQAVAQTLWPDGADRRVVRGLLSAIDLVDLSAHVVETVAKFELENKS